MFWVISVYFNVRNTLPKSGTFLLGHPVYGEFPGTCIVWRQAVTNNIFQAFSQSVQSNGGVVCHSSPLLHHCASFSLCYFLIRQFDAVQYKVLTALLNVNE